MPHSRCADEVVGTAAVRCCIDGQEHVCGASICANHRGGQPALTDIDPSNATYNEAAHECREQGMRLCEAFEVRACCATGCGYDDVAVWTHTLCSPMTSEPGSDVVTLLFVVATLAAVVVWAKDAWRRLVAGRMGWLSHRSDYARMVDSERADTPHQRMKPDKHGAFRMAGGEGPEQLSKLWEVVTAHTRPQLAQALSVCMGEVSAKGVLERLPCYAAPPEPGGVPERLRLGISIGGLKAFSASLPSDAVQRANKARATQSAPRYEDARTLNLYVARHFLQLAAVRAGQVSACEVLAKAESLHVGPATAYVSCDRQSDFSAMLSALEGFLEDHPELPRESTYFWLCDFSTRLYPAAFDAAAANDLPEVGAVYDAVMRTIGLTLLVVQPWHEPLQLHRTHCLQEVACARACGARFELAMSASQRQTFTWALDRDVAKVRLVAPPTWQARPRAHIALKHANRRILTCP